VNKRQASKKKISLKLLPGEAALVADVETLKHISATYRYMASECSSIEEAESWNNVAETIDYWVDETYYLGDVEDFDEEW
jgi:hypothetical protein